ncbi:hypothetical protein SNE40_016422 [Patella caerulea]|uniref:Uncharacterized protein n=1 Tax=Patella caerulea TaxID=87958 RepID=A0AAN8PC45_PATCE
MKDDFFIYVATGDKKHAGTDANVAIILHGENGISTQEIILDNFFKNDFERGHLDVFRVCRSKLGSVGKVGKIELWRDNAGLGSDWYVDKIIVENAKTKEQFVFPILRWIKAGFHYKIKHLDTSLPQCDRHSEQRKMELEDKKKLYQFESKLPGLPVQIKDLPDDELFSFDYLWDITTTKVQLLASGKYANWTTGKWESMEHLKNIYKQGTFPLPQEPYGWKDDLYFGRQRLANANTILIKLCTAIPEKLAVTESILEPMLEGNKLQDLLKDKRIYICDLEILDGIKCLDGITLCAPIALFMVDNNKELRPIAIQLYQKPGADNPVFLPTDHPYTWIVAKMWYNNADAAYHQSLTHLAFTHLAMEGVSVATHRNLSQSHPVFKILAPHFLYLLAINTRALQKLVSPGGWIDKSMTTGANGLFELVRRGVKDWRMDVDGTLPEDLKNRGVDDVSALPNYHYRDDALLLYEAIKNYVTKYVDLYYDSTEKIDGDWELQSWAQELSLDKEKGGVGLQGVPNGGVLKCKEDIILVINCVIFNCSVTHAAANFLQYEQYALPANYPSLMRGNPPKTKDAIDEKKVVDYLPDKRTTLDVMVVTKILSGRGTKCLGDFEVQYVFDPKAVEIVDQFRADLKVISKTIKDRNKTRKHKYDILDPELIPNAISI